jgi:Raf kinase inhibitor-like YbhB/YbcL family protein
MRKQYLVVLFITSIILLIGVIILQGRKISKKSGVSELQQNNAEDFIAGMKIVSSTFDNNQNIPSKYTCDGENINPPLTFSAIPNNAKSLVLIVDDPDAPGGVWTHWILFNIPPATQNITENSVPPEASQGMTSLGSNNYGGPCPPSGAHHYFFKLFALDTKLNLTDKTDSKNIQETMKGHIIEQTQLVGVYSR